MLSKEDQERYGEAFATYTKEHAGQYVIPSQGR